MSRLSALALLGLPPVSSDLNFGGSDMSHAATVADADGDAVLLAIATMLGWRLCIDIYAFQIGLRRCDDRRGTQNCVGTDCRW